MPQSFEFSTVLLDNEHIQIPLHLQPQLKAHQAVRVMVLIDSSPSIDPKK